MKRKGPYIATSSYKDKLGRKRVDKLGLNPQALE